MYPVELAPKAVADSFALTSPFPVLESLYSGLWNAALHGDPASRGYSCYEGGEASASTFPDWNSRA